ncbi:MAG: hypothetical protein N2Z74_08805, partial [Syntrophales bacterium]|nr:hypothetical protein [Syntrophales bacterium]
MTSKKKILLIVVSVVVATSLLTTAVFLVAMTATDTWCRKFADVMHEALGREVTCGGGTFHLRGGPRWSFSSVAILERDGKTVFVTIEELAVAISPLPLLMGKVVLPEVRCVGPRMVVRRDGRGRWNVADLLDRDGEKTVRIGSLSVEGGRVEYRDAQGRWDEHVVILENLRGAGINLVREENAALSLRGVVVHRQDRGTFALE